MPFLKLTEPSNFATVHCKVLYYLTFIIFLFHKHHRISNELPIRTELNMLPKVKPCISPSNIDSYRRKE